VDDRVATALCVLGPLEVVREGEPVRLGSAQQRRLLTALLIHANEVVSSDRLIDVLWGDDPPPSATHTLQALVSRLRATLGDDRLETRAPGYRLRIANGDADAVCFEEFVRVGLGSADRPEVALRAFDEALGLWRGLPYAEFASEEFAAAEVARLVELRARAIEERSAALLELDRPDEVLGELEAEIAAEPFRERRRAILMLALARAGRPVESLRAYDEFRRFLADEVGVVPSPALQELNDDIVRQHPDVSWAGSPRKGAGTPDLPSGTVTFLFTDVEGSTRLWEECPDVMRHTMARHDAMLREAFAAHDGHVVKAMGDGFHAVFGTAHDAVTAAVAAQTELLSDEWDISETVRVRMGIHTGEAEIRDGDYYGSAVNRAARLMSVAHGAQIVVSSATQELLHDTLPEKYGFLDLGEHRLRDLGRPERLFQVTHPDLDPEFPPLRTSDAFSGSLPLPTSSFVGREVELVRVADALAASRVVTLTGVGGVGKTRLALQAAGEVLPRFPDGAWLCDLSSVRDPAAVVVAVAKVFRVSTRPALSLEESVVAYLRDQELLLVLDNCEHLLLAVTDLVVAIEAACGGVRVLATSREGLNIAGEQILVVPPLGLPDDASSDTAGECDAVRLFAERARAVKSGFTVDDTNRADVVAVCTRLDGVPLGIELAAAPIGAMSPSEIAGHLDLRFLTRGGRVASERHQTLRAAIDWSYDLLSEREQRLLARLAVFSGGCTLEAAEAVCAGDPIDGDDVYELLANLVARSLIVADDGPETRYRLLQTIREYGGERLTEAGEIHTLRLRHADYYTVFTGLAASHMAGPGQVEWGARLAAERENLLAAMTYALDTRNIDLAFALFSELPAFDAQVNELVAFDPAPLLAMPGAADHPGSAVALMTAAHIATLRGDAQLALQSCDEALAVEQRLGPTPGAFLGIASAAVRAQVAVLSGAMDEAVAHNLDGVRRARADNDPVAAAVFLGAAAQVGSWVDPAAARQHATEGLLLARQSGMPSAIVANLTGLAVALADDDPAQGRALLAEARQLASTLGYESPTELLTAVMAAARLGEWPTALRGVSRVLHHFRSDALRPSLLSGFLDFAARGLAEPQPEPAAMLQGSASALLPPMTRDAAARLRVSAGSFLPLMVKVRGDTTQLLAAALGEVRLDELRAQGAAMDEPQACTYARIRIEGYLATSGEASADRGC
jgi:predicted ATPase/class 3 adenylate cyclase